MSFSPWAVLTMWMYIGALQNRGKINVQPNLNKNLPRALMELEFDVLSVAKKLVTCPNFKIKENNWCQSSFWSQGILEVKLAI
jgi:hypothetical protein